VEAMDESATGSVYSFPATATKHVQRRGVGIHNPPALGTRPGGVRPAALADELLCHVQAATGQIGRLVPGQERMACRLGGASV
jgi:hypothetical protein